MVNSDFIINWVEDLRSDEKKLSFHEDDIRKNFYGLLNDIAYCYYRDFLLIEVSILLHEKKISFGAYENNKHFKAISALIKNEKSYNSHFNSLNRHLIIDAWSTFELCLNIFCNDVCSSAENEKLLSTKYNDIVKIIGKSKLSEVDLEKLKLKFTEENLTHVAIVRKTDALFKKAKGYSRNIEEDKKFLLFFLRLRNAMHGNFIYSGKSFVYDFGQARFIFEDGKIIKWHDPFKETPKLYFYLMGNLKEIWKALILAIPFNEIIYYPDLEQE